MSIGFSHDWRYWQTGKVLNQIKSSNPKVTSTMVVFYLCLGKNVLNKKKRSLITMFVGPAWGPSGADKTQMGPMLAPSTLLSGLFHLYRHLSVTNIYHISICHMFIFWLQHTISKPYHEINVIFLMIFGTVIISSFILFVKSQTMKAAKYAF